MLLKCVGNHNKTLFKVTVHAKPWLSQVNDRQNVSATGKKLEIISQIVLWYENSFRSSNHRLSYKLALHII